ncbi:uvrC: excinuclease ABC subunit C [Rubrobacter radiotolerans]|uniref:UvrABC system protein C n=1 Tax=Rubrobacter radiotolerans TaxID=42256 RepID=A0A023X4H2_RUBRA|nr:excinuclease ABC subunit UvrC [Rubrobacter radiotolerans]AHY47071.1 uvrC: excinuclease ABC subunit C [Rubrobacter radiotolerans]MDX5894477.1 excinuclease ABC subunit UvrC [Rubrobacter radiotolerans]SMC06082.1 Excinuclease ABC subunit C [Rubrobacter radiotolerans DSM 5868]
MPDRSYPDRSHLPTSPGVYIFRDSDEVVIYVGKAKNLRSRVANYFTKSGDGRPKIAELRERVEDIDFISTKSETEALVLEANLIKRYRPRFNASLRDDKSYPYIVVTTGDEYPRVFASRGNRDPRHRYFGPFPSAGSVHATLDVLNKTFPFRKCRGPEPGRRSGVPCLNYHIGRSAAPCIGAVTKEEYDGIVREVIAFLEGRVDGLIRDRETRMKEAAREMDFERAAKLRDELSALRTVRERQQATIASEESFDAFGAYVEGETACVQVFAVRDGQVTGRDSFLLDNYGEADADSVALQFIPQFYDATRVPREVLVASADEEALAPISEHLSELRGTRVDVRRPQRGDKRRILELAQRNAEMSLEHERTLEEARRNQVASTLDDLMEELALPRLPLRIECYDISNTMGTNSVASMVVFQGGRPAKSEYRRFRIKTVEGADDFASMAEVIRRRLERLNEGDEKFLPAPDLILLDGGKGQLSAVVPVMEELDPDADIPLRSLAKRDEWVFEPGKPDPVVLERNSPHLRLLQRVRDEAHRFANTYHKKLRGKAMTASVLDELPGVGPARKKRILDHFGTPDAFMNASVEELEEVLPGRVARQVHARIHR